MPRNYIKKMKSNAGHWILQINRTYCLHCFHPVVLYDDILKQKYRFSWITLLLLLLLLLLLYRCKNNNKLSLTQLSTWVGRLQVFVQSISETSLRYRKTWWSTKMKHAVPKVIHIIVIIISIYYNNNNNNKHCCAGSPIFLIKYFRI